MVSCFGCHQYDGGQHAEQLSNDLQRTEYLKVSGYRVIRFWNHEVLGDPDAVVNGIPIDFAEEPIISARPL
ncbi:MAG: DUF559 domain-containing protein [Chromatiales bacterium]